MVMIIKIITRLIIVAIRVNSKIIRTQKKFGRS